MENGRTTWYNVFCLSNPRVPRNVSRSFSSEPPSIAVARAQLHLQAVAMEARSGICCEACIEIPTVLASIPTTACCGDLMRSFRSDLDSNLKYNWHNPFGDVWRIFPRCASWQSRNKKQMRHRDSALADWCATYDAICFWFCCLSLDVQCVRTSRRTSQHQGLHPHRLYSWLQVNKDFPSKLTKELSYQWLVWRSLTFCVILLLLLHLWITWVAVPSLR